MNRRTAFVAWMLGYPIATAIQDFLGFHGGGFPDSHYSVEVLGMAALVSLMIWFIVGAVIWIGGDR